MAFDPRLLAIALSDLTPTAAVSNSTGAGGVV
jgi:hypothetical protein